MSDTAKDTVRRGFDAASYACRGDTSDDSCTRYHDWLDDLIPLLGPGAAVLDLGCGCGVPVAVRLAKSFDLTGVDISPVQIDRAKRNVPGARFVCADMTTLQCPYDLFSAVVALYSITHVPIEEQYGLLEQCSKWLHAEGYLLATVGHREWTGTRSNWLGSGADMFWSHADEDTYVEWLSDLGFRVLWTRFLPDRDRGRVLLLAQR